MLENPEEEHLIKKSSVLITGAGGLVGKYLTSLLISEGYVVSHLSRNVSMMDNVKVFIWDPEKGIIDAEALKDIDYIIHLAGANIGEKRWTKVRKKDIVDSRVVSAKLLQKVISERKTHLIAFISASATGYYGTATIKNIFTEVNLPGNDFLATTCRLWEEAADMFVSNSERIVKIRTGVVLEKNHGILSKFLNNAKFGFLFILGNGSQYIPWIHIDDLCRIYLKAIQDSNLNGAFNAVSPQQVTHRNFLKILAKVINVPLFPLHVPACLLKLLLGEMSDIIVYGSRISPEKLLKTGYKFIYEDLEEALKKEIL